ncbi:alpha/beta hydrolase [Aquibacillus kalidii]|uniref:alpha/beta hydrolase n=1 Tax=Aquibacillus kalidii TaxID=2762597 RepID=UPI001F23F657|nr:alpha/beta hydrolase [Aquibacillus kalidii]
MFHRPGLGLSDLGENIRNTQAVVMELKEIMYQLELNQPVILVGHSYGGLCAQHFAKKFPELVAGMVLVDSTSVNLHELDQLVLPVLDGDETDESWLEKCRTYSTMEKEELRELISLSLSDKQKQFPIDIQDSLLTFQINPSMYKAIHDEISNWKKDADTIIKIGEFPDIPLVVIGRDKDYNVNLGAKEGFPEWEVRLLEEKWEELIINQTDLSVSSELIFAKESSHSIHIDRPDVVIGAIKKIVQQI